MAPLTRRQQEVLTSIKDFIRTHGFSPTLREIAQAIGVRSTNCVDDHLRALARKGYLRRGVQARSVVVTDDRFDRLTAEERLEVEGLRRVGAASGAVGKLLAVIDRLAPVSK